MKERCSQTVRSNGVEIHVDIANGAGRLRYPVLLLHGFTGSGESMSEIASRLRPEFTTLCVDLVGHGRSDAPKNPDAYSMRRCVAQLESVVVALGYERVHLFGYSMGGRSALSLAVAADRHVASVLAIGVNAGFRSRAARQERIESDRALARDILGSGIETFVDEWMARPLFATQKRLGEAALARARAERLRNRPDGLANSLRGMGTGAMEPIDFEKIAAPVCLAVGADDPRFQRFANEIHAVHPRIRVEIIPEAGHAAHLENPDSLARIACRFFAAAERAEIPNRTPEESPAKREGGSA